MSHPADISDFKPTSLSHLIGQRKVIDQVVVALDAAQQDSKRFDHAMLTGPPGLGKSALAYVIAQEMATGFCEVLGQSLNGLADLNAVLLSAKHRDVVFIDECHEMRREFQTTLYRVLDTQCVSVCQSRRNWGPVSRDKGARPRADQSR
jgi:Holliday junction DNA helicase RuvB